MGKIEKILCTLVLHWAAGCAESHLPAEFDAGPGANDGSVETRDAWLTSDEGMDSSGPTEPDGGVVEADLGLDPVFGLELPGIPFDLVVGGGVVYASYPQLGNVIQIDEETTVLHMQGAPEHLTYHSGELFIALPNGPDVHSRWWLERDQSGRLGRLEPTTHQLTTLNLPIDPWQIFALAGDVYVTGASGQHVRLYRVDIEQTVAVANWSERESTCVVGAQVAHLSPFLDPQVLYLSRVDGNGRVVQSQQSIHVDRAVGRRCISFGETRVVTSSGAVWEATSTLRQVDQIESWSDGTQTESGDLVLVGHDGNLRRYSRTLNPLHIQPPPGRLLRVVTDGRRPVVLSDFDGVAILTWLDTGVDGVMTPVPR